MSNPISGKLTRAARAEQHDLYGRDEPWMNRQLSDSEVAAAKLAMKNSDMRSELVAYGREWNRRQLELRKVRV